MPMFYKYDLSGVNHPIILEFPIAAATAVIKGAVVKLTAGLVVLAGADETGAILGVAAEDHTGAADIQNPRSNGTVIEVYCSPTAVFGCKPNLVLTATSGSSTTFAATALGTYADDDWNQGTLVLKTKAAASTLTDPVGTVYDITGFTAATDLFTGVFPGGVVAGDKMLLLPPRLLAKGSFTATTIDNINYLVATGTAQKVVDVDVAQELVYWMPTLHQLGNKAS